MSELAKPPPKPAEPPELWEIIALVAGIIAVVSAFSIPSNSTAWKNAELALSHWQQTPARIDHIETRFKKRHYVTYSGTYRFQNQEHTFRTREFEESDVQRATGRELREGDRVTLHVNSSNPAESLFEAKAQVEIFHPTTANNRYLAASCGLLCLIGIALQFHDRRRFRRQSRT